MRSPPPSWRITPPDEADLTERPAEQPVHLVAPSAPAPFDQLVEDRLGIDARDQPELHVEVLERDRRDVGVVERMQRPGVRAHVPAMADALEIPRQAAFIHS